MNNKIRIDKKNIRIFGIMLFLVVTLFVAFLHIGILKIEVPVILI